MTEESLAPIITRPNVEGVVKPRVVSEEAAKFLNIEPVKTTWGQELGYPIYHRLPSIEEGYRLGYDYDQCYVYIDPDLNLAIGQGTLEVGAGADDQAVLVILDGEITWPGGQVKTPIYEIDTRTLDDGRGLDGEYQVGFNLTLDYPVAVSEVPGYAKINVTNATLSEAAVGFAVSSAALYHNGFYTLTDEGLNGSWWPSINQEAGDYSDGSTLTLDFKAPIRAEEFVFNADPDTDLPTGTLAVYYSDDAIVWTRRAEVRPIGRKWTADVGTNLAEDSHRYWRFFWFDGTATVECIHYTGEAYYPDLRTSFPISIATPYIDDRYEDIEGTYLLLAYFTVQNGIITSVTDQRRFIYRKYEPVASWLTSFQDTSLRCLFTDVEKYAERYMAPPTADYHLYDALDDNLCTGLGQFNLGEETAQIVFPESVEIVAPSQAEILYGPTLFVNDAGDLLSTDPYSTEADLAADTAVLVSGVGIDARGLQYLQIPVEEGDAANKGYTDETLNATLTIDNGVYFN